MALRQRTRRLNKVRSNVTLAGVSSLNVYCMCIKCRPKIKGEISGKYGRDMHPIFNTQYNAIETTHTIFNSQNEIQLKLHVDLLSNRVTEICSLDKDLKEIASIQYST